MAGVRMNTRATYASKFEAFEAAVARFAATAQQIIGSKEFSDGGAAKRLIEPRAQANASARGISTDIGLAVDADRAAIAEVLDTPEQPVAVEVALARQYAQQIALREFPENRTNSGELLNAL